MPHAARQLPSWLTFNVGQYKKMRAVTSFAILACLTACAKKESNVRLYEQEQLMLAQPGPVSGRAEAVTPVALIREPGKYSGKRVIMAGIWTSGFEHSFLDL